VVLEALTQTVALVLALSVAAASLMASTGKFQKTKKKKKSLLGFPWHSSD
jgi:hypothetical protein